MTNTKVIRRHRYYYREKDSGRWVNRVFALMNPELVDREEILLVDKETLLQFLREKQQG